MSDLEKIGFTVGLNEETAEWLNCQHQRMKRGTRLLVDVALAMGEVLAALQNSEVGNLQSWLKSEIEFPQSTAYQYISLHNYRNQISSASNLTEAYKLIETIESQKSIRKHRKPISGWRNTGKPG